MDRFILRNWFIRLWKVTSSNFRANQKAGEEMLYKSLGSLLAEFSLRYSTSGRAWWAKPAPVEAHGTGLRGQHKGHSPDGKLGPQKEGGGLLGPQLVRAVPGDTLEPPPWAQQAAPSPPSCRGFCSLTTGGTPQAGAPGHHSRQGTEARRP